MTGEVWKEIPWCGGDYEVSNMGRVRSVTRRVTSYSKLGKKYQRTSYGRELAPSDNGAGYKYVTLSREGIPKKKSAIHRIVLKTFSREPKPGEEARHMNNNRSDNRLSNLQWGTAQDNTNDMLELHGGHYNSRKSSCKYGHSLENWNLTEAGNREGKRKCLTCNRARSLSNSGKKSRDYANQVAYARVIEESKGKDL